MISCPLPGFAVRSKVRDGVDYRITVLSMDDYDNEERVTVSVAAEPSCHTDVRLTKNLSEPWFWTRRSLDNPTDIPTVVKRRTKRKHENVAGE